MNKKGGNIERKHQRKWRRSYLVEEGKQLKTDYLLARVLLLWQIENDTRKLVMKTHTC